MKSKKAVFENLFYSFFQTRKIIPVRGYYQSIEFDYKNTSLRGKKILDFGCGAGLFSLYALLIGAAKHVVSIDEFEGRGAPSENYERLNDIVNRLGLVDLISVLKGDGVSYDFKQQKFDLIYCSYVLHHIFPKGVREDRDSIVKLFSKFEHLLEPKGKVIVREVMRHNVTEHLPRRLKPFPVLWKTKRNSSEWIKSFQEAGFKKVSKRYYIPYYLHYTPFNQLLSNRVASYFLTSRYVLECEK